jgi:hypothetical protein
LAKGVSPDEPLPHWALSAFTPSEKDKGQLSLFAIDADIPPCAIAAALAFNRVKVEAHLFVTADSGQLEDLGFKLSRTVGDTDHPAVNERHYEIELQTVDQVGAAARAFIGGEMEFVDIKEINAQLVSDARRDAIDWMHLAANAHENAWKKSMAFIKTKAAEVRGIAVDQSLSVRTGF